MYSSNTNKFLIISVWLKLQIFSIESKGGGGSLKITFYGSGIWYLLGIIVNYKVYLFFQ